MYTRRADMPMKRIIFRDHFRYNGAHNSVEGERRMLDNLLKDRGPGKRKIIRRTIYVPRVALEGSFFELRDGAAISDDIKPASIQAPKRSFSELCAALEAPAGSLFEPRDGAAISDVVEPASVLHVRTFPDVVHEHECCVLATVVDALEGIELLVYMKHGAE